MPQKPCGYIDIFGVLRIILYIIIFLFKCPQLLRKNRELGANPERYRRCKCGECLQKALPKLIHCDFSWEGADISVMHKSEDLLEFIMLRPRFMEFTGALTAQNGCGDFVKKSRSFIFCLRRILLLCF